MAQKYYLVRVAPALSEKEKKKRAKAKTGRKFGKAGLTLAIVANALLLNLIWFAFGSIPGLIIAIIFIGLIIAFFSIMYLLSFIFSLIGLIKSIKGSGTPDSGPGKGMSIAGLVLSTIKLFPLVVIVGIILLALGLAIILIPVAIIFGGVSAIIPSDYTTSIQLLIGLLSM